MNPGGGCYVTYPQGLSAGRGEPADGSFTIIFRQDLAIRQRTFLAFLSAWMIVNANSSSHSSCRCALSRVPFKRHTAASPKKTPRHSKCGGEWRAGRQREKGHNARGAIEEATDRSGHRRAIRICWRREVRAVGDRPSPGAGGAGSRCSRDAIAASNRLRPVPKHGGKPYRRCVRDAACTRSTRCR